MSSFLTGNKLWSAILRPLATYRQGPFNVNSNQSDWLSAMIARCSDTHNPCRDKNCFNSPAPPGAKTLTSFWAMEYFLRVQRPVDLNSLSGRLLGSADLPANRCMAVYVFICEVSRSWICSFVTMKRWTRRF